MVDMDNWIANYDTENTSGIMLGSYVGSVGETDQPGYIGKITNEGKIEGEIPAYVKKVDSDEFLEVTALNGTFCNKTELKEIPKIPDTVKYLEGTFYGCTKLTKAPEIPDGVISMAWTFKNCTELTQAPEVKAGVKDMYSTFENCIKLTGDLIINSVENEDFLASRTLTGAAIEDGCDLILSGSSPYLEEVYETKSAGAHITCPQIDNANTGE